MQGSVGRWSRAQALAPYYSVVTPGGLSVHGKCRDHPVDRSWPNLLAYHAPSKEAGSLGACLDTHKKVVLKLEHPSTSPGRLVKA